ncbi:MAG: hypothetical protein LPK07_08565 [Hymenobacteraceae bacterium]|nr:hypothetical protein [Hymenobacteraceae bacterium]MDX5481724.1 hypothetical protein [Hymenobacteraceae bacterium]
MRLLLLLCLLVAGHVSLSQQYNFRNWTLEQGLPQSQVNDILQDYKGQLWLATRGGVSCFNGRDFTTYTKDEGLSSNNISRIFEDSRRHLWIGTTDGGVVRYDGVKFRTYGAEQGLPAKTINSIAEDRAENIWVATEQGIFYYTGKHFRQYTPLPTQPYNTVLHTPEGVLWIGSRTEGLYRIAGQQVERLSAENSNLPSNNITVLSRNRDGTIWVGTEAGPAYIHDSLPAPLPLPESIMSPAVSSFAHDTYGNLWIGLRQNGVVKYDGKSFTHLTRHNGLRTKRITTLATDIEGNVWIGTNGYGLQQYVAPWFVHYFEFGSLSEPRITALTQDPRGRVWFGTDEGKAAYMENGRHHWLSRAAWPQDITVNDIWFQNEEEMWVSTSNGAWHLKPDTSIHYNKAKGLAADEVYQCRPDTRGNLWFATASGVSCYSKGRFVNYHPSDATLPLRIYHILQDSKNRLWFGTVSGVYKLQNNKLMKAPEFEGFQFEEVTSIAEDQHGVLYFGGFNYGIMVLSEKWAEPKLITSAEGLTSESIKGLFVDSKDNLWVGTSRNMLKIELPPLRQTGSLQLRSYASHNGFKGNEIGYNAITQTEDGNVWFGTTKGITNYLPDLDQRNKVYPATMIKDVMLYQKPTDWRALGYTVDSLTKLPVNLRLPHTQNHLTFDFFGICMSGPEQVKYRYRLRGYEEQWSPATNRSFASYPNLTPGTYTFELLAQNNDGYWTPRPATYTFAIVPPIWRREWFVGVLLLVVAGAVLSIVRIRERSLVKMNTLLEMKVNNRTRLLERKNREKETLLQEIHHRVKNNLQIVISLLNLQARHVQDPAALEVMQAIRSRVRSMALLHERLYLHDDLAHIDLESYFREICDSLYASYGVSQDDVRLELQLPPIQVDIDSAITLGLIVNELVSNTLKYAFPQEQQGLLRIILEQQDNSFYTLTVSDNGVGLPANFENKSKHSFGLQLVKSLSRKLNGHIDFENINGTKAIFHFVLPS